MKLTYQRKLTLSFLIIFVTFAVGVVVFEHQQAKKYRTEALEEKLDAYAGVIHEYITAGGGNAVKADSLIAILPQTLRLTVIGQDGKVLYDNLFPEPMGLGDHSLRPEVLKAKASGEGFDVRTSASNSVPYIYYAKYFGDDFVRVALPYDIEVRSFLKPDNAFIYFILALLVVGIIFIRYVGGLFGKSIRSLRDFSVAAANDEYDIELRRFPKDELGEIGERIVRDYKRLKDSELNLVHEREKLLQHVQSSAEGVCFFNADKTVAFYNGLFLQYINTVSDTVVNDNPVILTLDVFRPVRDFLKTRTDEKYFEARINNHGREFMLRVNVFDDESFEVVFNDITRQEKTRRLKQEMTGNIAHELRTPVTSVRGYLETMLNMELPPDKQRDFLQKAYNQTISLSELIRDMGLLTKIEETPDSFAFGRVVINDVIAKVETELEPEINRKGITIRSAIEDGLAVKGNVSLIYSVFRNLTDNVISHAGDNVEIVIRKIGEKDGFVYMSFADNGYGIKDQAHLSRLFERFYRVDAGRTRDSGGSGLGLSIVRNVISLHGGNITVKDRIEGGLEFIFSLPVAA